MNWPPTHNRDPHTNNTIERINQRKSSYEHTVREKLRSLRGKRGQYQSERKHGPPRHAYLDKFETLENQRAHEHQTQSASPEIRRVWTRIKGRV
jgi:hypothetical protein